MSKCLWCGKECPQTPGRRERLYCNGNCRASYSQKRSAELAREIRISEGFTGKPGRPRAGIPLKTKKLVKVPRETKDLVIDMSLIPPERDTILGRKIWRKEQEEKLKHE